jgi:hypothetical protein
MTDKTQVHHPGDIQRHRLHHCKNNQKRRFKGNILAFTKPEVASGISPILKRRRSKWVVMQAASVGMAISVMPCLLRPYNLTCQLLPPFEKSVLMTRFQYRFIIGSCSTIRLVRWILHHFKWSPILQHQHPLSNNRFISWPLSWVVYQCVVKQRKSKTEIASALLSYPATADSSFSSACSPE